MSAPVYFDHNATTPVHPDVFAAMRPWFAERFGNASGRHTHGRYARQAIDEARERIAAAVGAQPGEVVFTSCGSEANNLFIKGAAARINPGILAVSAIEHPCVLRPAEQLARQGWQMEKLAVDAQGRIDIQNFDLALARKPKLVSIMLANNETGVIQEIPSLAAQTQSSGAWFHTDAVQALGRIDIDFRTLNAAGVHAMTLSAHKIGGTAGAAALIVDKRLELEPLIAGGGHEQGIRSGTENVAAIVGFAVACERAVDNRDRTQQKLQILRDRLERGLMAMGARIFAAAAQRLANTVCFALPDIEGETLVAQLDRAGFALSSGSACSSANPEPSHVLQAMGIPPPLARCALRVSLAVSNSSEQIDDFLLALRKNTLKLKQLAAIAARS